VVLGKEEPQCAADTDLKRAIAIGLDEAMTALEEAFYDLPDERERLAAVRAAVMETLEQATPDDLARPDPGSWWFEENPTRVRADAYLRATFHTMAHVRQIWMLRGVMGLTDKEGWPVQHWA